MPLYEYRCESCAHVFESYKRLSDRNRTENCPACGASARKVGISLFSAPGGSAEPSGGSCGGGGRRSPFS